MKLTTRLLLLFLLLALAPVIVMGSITYFSNQNLLHEKTRRYLETINIQKIAQINQWLLNSQNSIEFLASQEIIREKLYHGIQSDRKASISVLNEETKDWLQRHCIALINQEIFKEVFLVCINSGEVIFSTSISEEGKDKSDREYFSKDRKTTRLHNIYYSISIREPTMTISTPVMDHDNNLITLLIGRLNLSSLSEVMQRRSGYSQSEDSYLVNKLGYYVTEPRYGQNYALRKAIRTTGGKEVIARQKGIRTYKDYRDISVVGAYEWVDEWGMGIITEINQSEYNEPILKMRNMTIILGALTMLMAILLGWQSGRTIIRPIENLVQSISSIDSEKLYYTTPPHLTGEMSILAQAFESLTKRLRTTLVSKKLLEDEITLRNRTEEQLQKTVFELNRSNKELEQFAYVASHDLQEPLRMVSSFTQLLEERYTDIIDDKGRKYIHFARDGAQRMQKLIQDLLGYSRVTSRGMPFVEVSTGKIVSQALENLSAAVEESSAVITFDKMPDVMGDPSQLLQVFQNLISNAIKFCENKPPRVTIKATRKNNRYQFLIKDNGIGIDKKYSEKIFTIFQRLHSRTEYPGTGIGLTICKRIIERHHGELDFKSDAGNGTTFFFDLQAAGEEVTS